MRILNYFLLAATALLTMVCQDSVVITKPEVQSINVLTKTQNSILLNVVVSDDGGAPVLELGIIWGNNASFDVSPDTISIQPGLDLFK